MPSWTSAQAAAGGSVSLHPKRNKQAKNFAKIAFYSPKMNLPSSGLAGGRAAGGLHGRATGGLDLGALDLGLGAALGSVLLLLLLLLPLLLLDLAAHRHTCR